MGSTRTDEKATLSHLGRYEIRQQIGTGGAGRVVEAVLHGPQGFRKVVALKLLHPGPGGTGVDPQRVASLIREARLGAMLSHPNVVSTLELGEVDGTWYVAMELVRGPPLSALLEQGPLPAAAILDVGLQVCAALGHVHGLVEDGVALHLVHRDVKPSNLLVDPSGFVRLADFGISGLAAQLSGRMSGTPGYMAPEQMEGRSEIRSDLFGLGMTLLSAVRGSNPLGRGLAALHATHHIEDRLKRSDLLGPVDGVLPGLGEVLHRCLRADPEQRWPDAAALARALRSLRPAAAGPSLAQLVLSTDTIGEDVAAHTTVPVSPSGLVPRRDGALFGRAEVLAASVDTARDPECRLVTLTGTAGVGKTRLAIEVASTLQRERNTVFCKLAAARTVAGMCADVAMALGVDLTDADPVAQLGQILADRGRSLLVLDNLEQVAAIAAEIADRWLEIAPELTILATSRIPLRISGERIVEVPPLDTGAAVVMFGERRGRPVEPAEEPNVHEILRRVDRLPLAIELVAARGRLLPVGTLLEQLSSPERLLTGGLRNADPRHQSLYAAIAWSWDLLAPYEASALAQLSVIEGSFTLEIAEALLDLGPEPDTPWALDVLAVLVEHGLVRVNAQRFELLGLVRAFAHERLGSSGGLDAAERRHGAHFASFGSEAFREAVHRPGGAAKLRELCEMMSDLIAASRRATARRDAPVAAGATLAALMAIFQRGPAATGIEIAESVLALPLDPLWRALVLEHEGSLFGVAGDPTRGLVVLQEALALYEAIGDPGLTARARVRMGPMYRRRAQLDVAAETLERALGDARASGHRWPEAQALTELGFLEIDLHRPHTARERMRQALDVFQAIGDRRGEGVGFANLGILQRDSGDLDGARTSFVSALAAFREVGDSHAEAIVHSNLGLSMLIAGNFPAAEEALRRSLALHRRFGARVSESHVLVNLGIVCWERGQLDDARECFDASLRLCRSTDNPRGQGVAISNLAGILADRGQTEQALQRYEEALALHRASKNLFSEALALSNRARLRLDRGDLDEAAHDLEAATSLAERIGNTSILSEVCARSARYLRLRGQLDEAASALERANALVASTGASGHGATVMVIVEEGLLALAAGDRARAEERLGAAEALVTPVGSYSTLRNLGELAAVLRE